MVIARGNIIVVALYKILITNSTECTIVPYTYICSASLIIRITFGINKVGSPKASENIYLYREVHLRAKFGMPRY